MERLMNILEELHSDVDYKECNTLIDEGILDSFDIIQLINEINEEFDIDIPPVDIVPENFNSADAIYAMIQRLQEE